MRKNLGLSKFCFIKMILYRSVTHKIGKSLLTDFPKIKFRNYTIVSASSAGSAVSAAHASNFSITAS